MNFWETLIIALVTAASAYLGSFISNKRNINRDNVNAKRERLLRNIKRAEEYLHLLVEFSFIKNAVMLKGELSESLSTNLTLVENEVSILEDQISFLENEPNKSRDPNFEKEYTKQYKLLAKKTQECKKKIFQFDSQIKDLESELEELKKTVEEFEKRVIDIDIEPTLYMIDPSGKITELINELAMIYSDHEKKNISANRIIELRLKINDLFNEKISDMS